MDCDGRNNRSRMPELQEAIKGTGRTTREESSLQILRPHFFGGCPVACGKASGRQRKAHRSCKDHARRPIARGEIGQAPIRSRCPKPGTEGAVTRCRKAN